MVSPGAIRIEILARAAATRVLLAPSTLGRVEAGDAQRRLGPQPLDGRSRRRSTRCRGPRRTRRAAAPRGTPRRRPGRCAGPATATLPRVVVQAGDQPGQRDQRVGHQAAPHAGVDGVGQRADLDVDADQAAQAGGQRGHADVPVAGVGDHDDVGAELVLVLAQQRGQGVGADLLLALDEHRDADRQVVAVHPQGAEVGRDAGLVVGGAAGVEAAVALGRLERRGVPLGVVVLGLDVVVGVEQHRRRALGARLVRDHRGRAAVGADDLDGVEALGPEQRGHRLGAALHLAGPRRVGADRLDADQVLEVLADPGQHLRHPAPDVVGRGRSLMAVNLSGGRWRGSPRMRTSP